MSNIQQSIEELDAVLHWRDKHTQAIRERDALQQRLTAADEGADVLETALKKISARCVAYIEAEREMPEPSVEVCQMIASAALTPAAQPQANVSLADEGEMQAAQHMVETVEVVARWSDWSMLTLEIDGQHRTYVDTGRPEQPAPIAVPERLEMTDGLHTYEYVTGHNAAIDKMWVAKS